MIEKLTALSVGWGPLGLALAAFGAGSVVPFPSEAVLAALIALGRDPVLLVLLATTANVLGATTLVYAGRSGRAFAKGRIDGGRMARAERLFTRFGPILVVLSFLPAIGDVFVVGAGVLRMRWRVVVPLLFVGKGARYTVVALGAVALLR